MDEARANLIRRHWRKYRSIAEAGLRKHGNCRLIVEKQMRVADFDPASPIEHIEVEYLDIRLTRGGTGWWGPVWMVVCDGLLVEMLPRTHA